MKVVARRSESPDWPGGRRFERRSVSVDTRRLSKQAQRRQCGLAASALPRQRRLPSEGPVRAEHPQPAPAEAAVSCFQILVVSCVAELKASLVL